MKVQLKFRNKVYEKFEIDEKGVIYDLEGNIQKTYQNQGRPHFKGHGIHVLIIHSFVGYKEGYDIHHKNFDKFDNRLCNLVYLSRSEHASIHFKGNAFKKGKQLTKESRIKISVSKKGKKPTQETRIKMSQSRKGNTITRDRIWINNGIINKMVYPNEIPEGFVRGVLRKV